MTEVPPPMTEYPQYQRETCYFCHEPDAHILEEHHIVPRRFGGSDEPANLVRLCPNCHERLERLYDNRFYLQLDLEQETDGNDDQTNSGTSAEQRERLKKIKSIISENESIFGECVPIEHVLDRAEDKGMSRSRAELQIEKLRRQGDVYEPETDHLRLV